MDEPKGSIDKLKTALYSKRGLEKHRDRRILRNWGLGTNVPSTWTAEKEADLEPVALFPGIQNKSLPSLILIGSIAFFVVCVAVAAFFMLGGGNLISNKNIDIAISGPVATPGGQELSLQVSLTNRNSVPIELADFIVEYPGTARSQNDLSLPLGRTRESIGTIKPGETINKNVRAVLFGKEGENQTLKMSLEYRVQGSNAIFVKDDSYDVLISSSPISVVENGLSEGISGQPLTFTLDVISNSPTPVSDVMIIAEYPFGFTFDGSDPNPSYDTDKWYIGTLNPGAKKTITVHGRLIGQQNEKREFKFTPGIQSKKNERELQTVFNVVTDNVALAQPFIGATLSVNQQTGNDFVAPAGESLSASLYVKNNLSTEILNPEIRIHLSGTSFDQLTVRSGDGFYDSGTKTIRWTKETVPTLDKLSPGEGVTVNFNVTPKDRINNNFISNPALTFDVTIQGRRLGETGVLESIQSTIVGHVKASSEIHIASRGVYTTGPWTNVGPIPPKVGVETTYTLVWTITNGANDVTNGKVSATLPSYVRWIGAISPADGTLSYNPVSRVLTWNVGNILARSGFDRTAPEVAFQVGFTPSTSQINSKPVLLSPATLTGTDQYTATDIKTTANAVTTDLTTDPARKNGDSLVQP